MLQQNDHYQPIQRKNFNETEGDAESPVITERKAAFFGLLLSLFVVSVKLWHSNRDYIQEKIFERRLISYETITEDGEVMFRYIWKTAIKFSRFWLPILCGFLTSTFTWMMVFLDSNIPGVSPPSPLSPTKYKVTSGRQIHLNYIFAVLIGVLVASYMFWKGFSVEF